MKRLVKVEAIIEVDVTDYPEMQPDTLDSNQEVATYLSTAIYNKLSEFNDKLLDLLVVGSTNDRSLAE